MTQSIVRTGSISHKVLHASAQEWRKLHDGLYAKDIELSIVYTDKAGKCVELTDDAAIEALIKEGVDVEFRIGECSRRGGPAKNTGGVQMFSQSDCVPGVGGKQWERGTQVRSVTSLAAYRLFTCDI